ncbi:MAG TPA: c-type cytochrome domain-containing protein [Tepidisphaeraceae bacterium]|jgi:WD40 repeat protein|nr:c-type cytochrome domain-containing protein [Tepidisphaeraceae bacterium]
MNNRRDVSVNPAGDIRHWGLSRISVSLCVWFAAAVVYAPLGAGAGPAGNKNVPIDIAAPDHPGPVDFEKEILPVFSTSCLACHNKTKAKSGLVLETPADIRKGGDDGPVVVPGKGAESLLLKSAAHAAGVDQPMPPPGNKVAAVNLTPRQLGLIRLWIDQGAAGEVRGNGAPVVWQAMPAVLDPIYAVAVCGDGRFAACGRANRIDVYDLPAGRLAASLVDPKLKSSGGRAAHRDMVESLAFSPDGATLASGSFREVKLWRAAPSDAKVELGTKPATCLVSNPDGTLLATAGEDGVVRLWESATGKSDGELTGNDSPTVGLCFSPDGAKVAGVSKDKAIHVWDVASRKPFGHVESPNEIRCVAFVAAGKQVAVGGADGLIRLWALPDAADGEMKAGKIFKGHEGPVNALSVIPGDDAHFLSGGQDSTVRRWNLDSGAASKQLKNGSPVFGVAARKDGKRWASVGEDGVAKLWNGDDQKLIGELKGDVEQAGRVAAADRAAALAKREIDYRAKRSDAAQKQVQAAGDRVKKAKDSLAPAEKALEEKQKAFDAAKSANDEAADVKDAAKKDKIAKDFSKAEEDLKQAQGAKSAAEDEIKLAGKDSDDGKEALALAKTAGEEAAKQGKTRAAEAADAKKPPAESNKKIRAIAFSADGALIATAGDDGTVRTWSAEKGLPTQTAGDGKKPIAAVAFAGAGVLAVCPADSAPALLQTGLTWKLDRTIGGADTSSPFADRVTSLDFSPDGKWLATGGGVPSRSGEIRLIDPVTGDVSRSFDDVHSDTVQCVRFSPNGKFLASASTDRFVRVLDLSTGKVVRSLEGHSGHALGVAWSHDGHTLVSVGADNSMRFWDAETGERGKVILGFDKEVAGVCYVGDADTAVAVSGDGKVRLVRDSGGDVKTYPGPTDFVYSVAATADGATIVAGGQDGVLRAWDVNSGQATGTFTGDERK